MSDEPRLPGPGMPDDVPSDAPAPDDTATEGTAPEATAPEATPPEATPPEAAAPAPEPAAPAPDAATTPEPAPAEPEGAAAAPAEEPPTAAHLTAEPPAPDADAAAAQAAPAVEETSAAPTADEPATDQQAAAEGIAPDAVAPVEGGRAARRRAAEAAAAAAAASGATSAAASDDAVPFVDEPAPLRDDDVAPGAAGDAGEGGRAARRRAAEEAARDAAQVSRRRALMVSGLVLAALALVGISLGAWSLMHRTPEASPTSGPTPTPTASGPKQPTLLVQVKTPDGVAVDSILTSVGGSVQTANMVGMPATLLLDPATGGELPLGQVARLPDINASGDALSDATGINVDGTWVMDTLAFSGLVDAVGGVTVNVDVDVFVTQPDGKEVVLVASGDSRLLEGPQAAAYATYLGPNEEEPARMARYQKVLAAVVKKLPNDPTKIEAIVTALGASARSSIPVAQLSAYLVKLRESVNADEYVVKPLPTTAVDGSDPTTYRLDQKKLPAFVQERFPDAKRTAGPNSRVRVFVQNGVGTPGLNTKARQLLVDAGFSFVNGGNAETFGHTTSLILIPDSSPESQKWGTDIATALKVPVSDVAVATDQQSVADVVVVLGADFTPTS